MKTTLLEWVLPERSNCKSTNLFYLDFVLRINSKSKSKEVLSDTDDEMS